MKEIVLKGLNEVIYEHTTKEGLKVYMWVNERVKATLMTLSVKYGSIHTKFKVDNKLYEVPDGTAHFLEHIKFNVDKDKTAHDLFYKLGGDANAFTTFNYTSYIVYATENKVENLNALLDFVYNPYFTKQMISKEKGIIIEEANMGQDDPYTICFYQSLQNIFKTSKYRNYITGKKDDIKKISLDDIKNVYNTFYHPKNMFLCITGNFNPYEMAQEIDNNLNKKKFTSFKEYEIIKEQEPKKVNNKYGEYSCSITYPRIKYALKIPVSKFKNIDKLDLKTMVNLIFNINFSSTSLFKEELINKGLIDNLYYNVDYYDDYLVITITVSTKYIEEVIKLLEDKLSNLELLEEDITRKRNATIATLILDYDDIETVNNQMQDDILEYNGIVDNMKERLENHTIDKLKSILKNITLDNKSISIFIPNDTKY